MVSEFNLQYKIYNSLRKYVDTTVKHNFPPNTNVKFFEYSNVELRLKQALSHTIMSKYCALYQEDKDNQNIDIELESISIINGKPVFKIKYFLKVFFLLLAGNAYTFLYILRGLFFGKKTQQSVAILSAYGRENIYESANKKEAFNFLNNGPFGFINTSKLYLGVNRHVTGDTQGVTFCKYPLLNLLGASKLSIADTVRICTFTFYCFFIYLKLVINFPIFILLDKDFFWLPTINLIGRKKLLNHFVFDNSDASKQLLPLVSLPEKTFITHMIFYACNTRGLKFKGARVAEHPVFQYLKADKVWVWNEEHADWVKKNIPTAKDVSVVGTVLFYNDNCSKIKLDGEFKILCFDVTPTSQSWTDNYLGGRVKGMNYYSLETTLRFLSDIEESTRYLSNNIKLFLKPKRQISKIHHNLQYVDYLNKNEHIHVLDYNLNLYSLVRSVDLVIAIPFTSALYISDINNIPSIFYDPSGQLECNIDLGKNSDFIQGYENLKEKINYHYMAKIRSTK